METKTKIIRSATFDPRIKKYLLIYGSLILVLTIFGILLIPFFLIGAPFLIRRYFDRLSAELTSRALRFEKGIIFHVERTIPLDKIQDLTFKEGPLLKAFGLSILKVETAGNTGAGQSDLTLIGIQDASGFRNAVLEQRDKVTENKYAAPEESDKLTITLLTDIRDSLHAIERSLESTKVR